MAAAAEGERSDQRNEDGRGREERPTVRALREREEDGVARQQDEDPAAVGAEAAAADSDERQCGNRGRRPAAEDRGARDRGYEQQRREQVRKAVEARVLRWAERRECHPRRVDPHRDEVRAEDACEQDAVDDGPEAGECDRRAGERENNEQVDPDVRPTRDPQEEVCEQDGGERRYDRGAAEEGEADDQRERDEQKRRLRVAVLSDPTIELPERAGRIVVLRRAELPLPPERGRGNVDHRDEPWDACRARREQASMTRPLNEDGIAPVIRLGASAG